MLERSEPVRATLASAVEFAVRGFDLGVGGVTHDDGLRCFYHGAVSPVPEMTPVAEG